ncbi:tRNA (adenosine(37)-N6)-threonylcarbamoyltransferase complex transferase subunit TsaD, partial [bacterium]|nr:tRNA (adenosine(37)-N6)-threonylcarbamoyltransferase complex transferase subunit TsaD [bacterium]
VAVFDVATQRITGHALYSQIEAHKAYGGVVPEIASRSQLEKIEVVVRQALDNAQTTIDQIDTIAVTNRPGLVGSLLVGVCFAKGIAFAKRKRLIGVDHLEGHMFSAFLTADGSVNQQLQFPFIAFSASGGHTALYLVTGFGSYQMIGHTLDDAAGEAFDKIAKIIGLGYPGGAAIERLATEAGLQDFFQYPRTKTMPGDFISFSVIAALTPQLQQEVSSSLLVCMGDIFSKSIKRALKRYPDATAVAFVGGVACNKYLRRRLQDVCDEHGKTFVVAPPAFCTDNGAMIAFVGSYKAQQGHFDDLELDVMKNT